MVAAVGDTVVMDNLVSHKVAGSKQDIEGAGVALRYLPPYRLDLNPIEQSFAKHKGMLRKAHARTFEALWSAVGSLLEQFSSSECKRYICHCGYSQSG